MGCTAPDCNDTVNSIVPQDQHSSGIVSDEREEDCACVMIQGSSVVLFTGMPRDALAVAMIAMWP